MIACQCNVITTKDIHAAMDAIWAEDPLRVLTPGLVFRRLEKRGQCCGCIPNIIDIMQAYADVCRSRDQLAPLRRRQIVAEPQSEPQAAPRQETSRTG